MRITFLAVFALGLASGCVPVYIAPAANVPFGGDEIVPTIPFHASLGLHTEFSGLFGLEEELPTDQSSE